MKEPNGVNLLKLLVRLLAEQEGVTINCTVEERQRDEEEKN